MEIKPVILSGGSGVRLWPLSRLKKAKQFIDIFSNKSSLFLQTMNRVDHNFFANPLIIANSNHRFEILKCIKKFNLKTDKIILETIQKNTAPACAVASYFSSDNAILCILPSDHYIENTVKFKKTIIEASKLADQGYLITLGAICNEPNTNYGYIIPDKNKKYQNGYKIKNFVEKPNIAKAEKLMLENAFWNTGIIIVKNSILKNLFLKYARTLYRLSLNSCEKSIIDREFILLNSSPWKKIKGISIDYAILEKKFSKVVLPLKTGWSDLGTFEALSKIKSEFGDILSLKSKNNMTYTDDKLLVTSGVNNLIIINTKNALLVSSKDSSENLRKVVDKLRKDKREEVYTDSEENRPWGSFQNIKSETCYKVKKLHILPGEKISLQKHRRRSEHWVVVEGKARITKGKEVFSLSTNESTFIKKGQIHRIENITKKDLIIIEVQTGEYLEEDDIIRIDDKYSR